MYIQYGTSIHDNYNDNNSCFEFDVLYRELIFVLYFHSYFYSYKN